MHLGNESRAASKKKIKQFIHLYQRRLVLRMCNNSTNSGNSSYWAQFLLFNFYNSVIC